MQLTVVTNVSFFFINCRIMDPMLSAQDVLRCDPCGTPVAPSYCVYCHVNLCEACTEDHLSDESKVHKVVSIEQRAFISHFDKDAKHVTIQCDQGAQKEIDRFEKFESDKEIEQKEIEKKIHTKRTRRKKYRKKNFRIADNIYVKSDEYDKIKLICDLNQLVESLALESQTSDEKKIIHGKRETASELLRFFLLFILIFYSSLYFCVFWLI